jgi:hypothetical protein
MTAMSEPATSRWRRSASVGSFRRAGLVFISIAARAAHSPTDPEMTDQSPMHAPDDALSFGDVVVRLRNLMRLPKGSPIPRNRLRNLLREGDLTAFVFVPGTQPREVQIPSSYWATVTTKRFASVRYKTGSRSKVGSFSLTLTDIPGAVADSFRASAEGRTLATDAFFSALEQSFAEAETMLEAFVSQGVFDLWIKRSQRNPQEQYVVAGKKERGRPEKNWEAVFATLVTILAEIIIKQKMTMPSMLGLAQDIHERAVDQHPDIPVVETIQGKIGELIHPP